MDLRIGDAERDAVASALHEHYAKGRLTREELDERLDTTLKAKTEGDLREIVKDLPGPTGLPELQPPQGRHHPAHWHAHRHGPPPLVPLLFAFFLIAAIGSGPLGLFIGVQLMFLLWLGMGLFAFTRLRRLRRTHSYHHRI